MAAPSKDRLLTLLASTTLNGIDFVEVRDTEPKNLFVHFVNTVVVDQPGLTAAITGGDRIPQVAVGPINTSDWTVDNEGRPLLTLNVAQRGDFSTYWLTVAGGDKLDPYFRHVSFSFFAFCPSLVECKPPDP